MSTRPVGVGVVARGIAEVVVVGSGLLVAHTHANGFGHCGGPSRASGAKAWRRRRRPSGGAEARHWALIVNEVRGPLDSMFRGYVGEKMSLGVAVEQNVDDAVYV